MKKEIVEIDDQLLLEIADIRGRDKSLNGEARPIKLRLVPATSSEVINSPFGDECPVNALELSKAMRVSRWTVQRWVRYGYKFEFGRRTTPGHLKNWLRIRAANTLPDFDLAKKLSELD